MDAFKKGTIKNYTAWDLNADCVIMKNKKRKDIVFCSKIMSSTNILNDNGVVLGCN